MFFQETRDVLPFVSLMKKFELTTKLQGDTQAMVCSLFEYSVATHEDNQEATALMVAMQLRPCDNQIAIKYHHFRIFVVNDDVYIQHIYVGIYCKLIPD